MSNAADSSTVDVTRATLSPRVGGVIQQEGGKDFWFQENSMAIVICVGSAAIAVGVLALVWKFVFSDADSRDRCRMRGSRRTPTKQQVSQQHALGVYNRVQADTSCSDFHYEFEGPCNSVESLQCTQDTACRRGSIVIQAFPINSTPANTAQQNMEQTNKDTGIEKSVVQLTSSLY